MRSETEHKLIAKTGETWTAALEWSGPSRKSKVPSDMIFLRFRIGGAAVLLSNYNATLKCGKNQTWYYEINGSAVRKIKKALEGAANSNAKITH